MKKGRVYTCNGCLAFEESVRVCPPGSPGFGSYSSKPFCGIGLDIEQKKEGAGVAQNFKPKEGTCPKPKNISNLVAEKTKFFESCHIKK
jgi:hypothetical protein